MSIKESHSIDIKEHILKSEKTVLLDFYAQWCGPCKNMDPTIKEFARENESKIELIKVDIDQYGDLAKSYSVQSIPTLILLKNGQEQKRSVGALSKQQLENFVAEHIKEQAGDEQQHKGGCCGG